MKKANLKHLSLLLTATLMTAVAGCATQAPTATSTGASPATTTAAAPNQQGQTNVRVQLSFLTQSLDAPLIVAINKGYFAEEGLNVSYERGFGNADTISKLGSGNFDMAFSDMYNALEFNQKNPNSKVMAVAITQNAAPFAIVSLKSSGITSPQDLAGKEIGAPAGDGPRKLFPLFAQSVGIDPNSVKWVTMDPKLRESFLLQGQVPAVSGFATSVLPSLYKAGRSPDDINVFYYNENGLDFYGNAILTRAAFAEQNPEAVRGFIKAYMRGMQDVLKDPTAGLDAVIAADQSKLMDRTAEKARMQIALERMFITPEVEKNGLGGVDAARLEKSLQQTAQGFGLQGTPKISDVFTDEFLPPAADRQLPPASERQPLN